MGVIDIDGKVSLEVFDTGDDRTRFKIVSDPVARGEHILLDERAVRCLQKHLRSAIDYMDAA